MKKIRLSIVIVLTLVAVLIPTQFAFAAKTADVTVNVTATKISIAVYNGTTGTTAAGTWKPDLTQLDYAVSKNDGSTVVGQATQANSGAADSGWHVRNTAASGNVDITIAANNLPTGTPVWTLSSGAKTSSSTASEYALWYNKTAANGSWTNFTSTSAVAFQAGVAPSGDTSEFWLSIQAPSDWTSAPSGDMPIVTFTAARAA